LDVRQSRFKEPSLSKTKKIHKYQIFHTNMPAVERRLFYPQKFIHKAFTAGLRIQPSFLVTP
jgi:hypothetical protein